MKTLSGKLLLLSAASMAFMPIAAMAQNSVDDEVVVTGIRKSLEEARDLKRNAAQFVDAIVADDIGKLPDSNVAESLGRVSGVQIQRGIGEGSDISIRGQRENVILFNGRQILDSTGRGGNGLDQLGTSTYGLLSQVPSELIGRLEVTKLGAADQISGAIGGTVDIGTRKPFDSTSRQIAASAGISYGDLSEEAGYELFGLYSDRYGANDEFGLLLSGVYNTRDVAEHSLGTFSGYGNLSANEPITDSEGNPVSNDSNGDGVPALFNLDPRSQQIAEERDNYGFNAIAQWQASPDLELTADLFYSKVESERDRHWIGYFAGFGAYSDVTFSENDVVVAGTVTRPIQTNVEFADVDSEIVSGAISGVWNATENLEVSAEVSYGESSATYDQLFFRLQSATATDITFDLRDGDFGSYSFSNDLTSPENLNLAIIFDNDFAAETQDLAFRSDAEWQTNGSLITSLQAGFRYQELETDNTQANVDIRPNTPASELSNFISIFSNDDFLPGELSGIPRSYLSTTRDAVISCSDLNSIFTAEQAELCANPGAATGSLLNSFTIEEDFLDFYLKANYEGSIGDIGVSGNFGVRSVSRDLTSTGNLLVDNDVQPNIFERDDTEVLPSAVMKLDISDKVVARLGAARVVSFPATEALNNGLQLFGNNQGQGGSPDLDPFLANQYDASIEYYFGEEALISAAVFYKDIDTFIIGSTQQENIPGQDLPFSISRQVNGDGSTVKGIELLYQQPLSFFSDALDGFGVIATYAYTDSETPIVDNTGANLTFPGLSENNVNLIGYYEKGPFTGRVAVNWRDEFVDQLGPGDTPVFEDSYTDLSATATWDFNDNFSLLLEGINLLDEQQRTFNTFNEALRTNAEFGRIYKATVRAKF